MDRIDRQALLDDRQLGSLRRLAQTSARDFGELIAVFSGHVPETIASLAGHLARNEQEKAIQVAHQLKGSAANFGAARLGALAGAIELFCIDGDLVAARSLARRLEGIAELTLKAYAEL